MSRVIPRFDTLAAAKYDSTPAVEKRHRTNLEEVYGENVFSLHEMATRLPSAEYEALLSTIQNRTELDPSVADAVAAAMKEWALEKGATHFTHWFQPLTGSTQPQNDTYKRQQGIAMMQTMLPFLEMGVVDPLKLAEHVLRDSFDIRNAQQFLTPQAYQMLQQQKQQELGQQGALGAPGNGVGLDAPQPTQADRADLGQQAQDTPSSF